MFPRRIFYWCGLTATQPFNTGIQRVTRCLASSLQKLGVEVIPVKSHGSTLALINQREADHLAKWGGPRFDMAQLTLPRRLVDEWVLIPEMTPFDAIGIAHALRMRSAPIFYDMIPLKMPELYNAGTLDWMIPYWRSFSKASVVLPISNTVSADLLEWQTENNLPNTFRSPCLLSGEIPGAPRGILKRAPRRAGDPIHLLAIGSLSRAKTTRRSSGLARAVAVASTSVSRSWAVR